MSDIRLTGQTVLILAPTGRDAALAQSALAEAGLDAQICLNIESLCRAVTAEPGAALIAKEALTPPALERLTTTLAAQPPWSDFPLIILTSGGRADSLKRRWLEELHTLGQATLLERPLRMGTLVSAVQVALLSRRRQFEVRDHLEERLRAASEHERLLGQLEAIIQNMAEGVAICDPAGNVLTLNPAHRRQLGFIRENEVRRHMENYAELVELSTLEHEPLRPAEWPMARVLQGETIENVEVQVLRRDTGHCFIGSYNGSPVYDQGGNLILGVITVRDVTEAKRLESELHAAYQKQYHIAETLQRSLLNVPAPNAFPNLEVETVYQAAWQEADVGGDFFDVFSLSEGKVALIVGDVSGKGLEAASRMAEVKYAMRAFLREYAGAAIALDRTNDFLLDGQLLDGQPLNNFVCLALGILDTASGELKIASAGAEAPMVLPKIGEARPVPVGGPPLGVVGEVNYIEHSIPLSEGDIVLFVTDGITEARRGPKFFDYTGLTETAERARRQQSLDAVGREILDEATAFAGGRLHDDVCLLLARYTDTAGGNNAKNIISRGQ